MIVVIFDYSTILISLTKRAPCKDIGKHSNSRANIFWIFLYSLLHESIWFRISFKMLRHIWWILACAYTQVSTERENDTRLRLLNLIENWAMVMCPSCNKKRTNSEADIFGLKLIWGPCGVQWNFKEQLTDLDKWINSMGSNRDQRNYIVICKGQIHHCLLIFSYSK